MNQKSLTKLEFPKIIEMLTDHASSPGGASFCRRIKPMTDLNKIITAQEQTAAAFTRIVKKGIPSFSGCCLRLSQAPGDRKCLKRTGTPPDRQASSDNRPDQILRPS